MPIKHKKNACKLICLMLNTMCQDSTSNKLNYYLEGVISFYGFDRGILLLLNFAGKI